MTFCTVQTCVLVFFVITLAYLIQTSRSSAPTRLVQDNGTQSEIIEYVGGNPMNIVCVIPKHFRNNITLEYHCAEKLHDSFETSITSVSAVGFRSTLRTEHHNCNFSCVYFEEEKLVKVLNFTFVLRNQIEDKTGKSKLQKDKYGLANNIIEFRFNQSYKVKKTCEREDKTALALPIPIEKIYFQMYERNGSQLIYSEYEEGDTWSFKCSMELSKVGEDSRESLSLSHGEDVYKVTLDSRFDNEILECKNSTIRMQILLHKFSRQLDNYNSKGDSTRLSTNYTESPVFGMMANDGENKTHLYWIIPVVCIVVLLFIFLTIYFMKKRNSVSKVDIGEKSNNCMQNTAIMQPTSALESHYAVPIIKKDVQISEISKSTAPETTYAELNLANDCLSENFNSERVIYSEIRHIVEPEKKSHP